jgi:hypothetical protein
MYRRIFPWLLPAVLALAFAVPVGDADATLATTFARPANCDAVPIASTPIHQNSQSVICGQWTDDDNNDDLISQASTTIAWVSIAFFILPYDACDILCHAFTISAAFPRGPPSALSA